jgi:undecaprenyl diphosphate synthase
MDGNGRWAKQRHQPRTIGHEQGAEAVDRVSTLAARLGIGQVTLYAFSTENWQRERAEVDFLMNLLGRYLESRRAKIMDNDLRFRQIGRRDRLPKQLVERITSLEQESRDNTGMTLCLAVDYGSRQEIASAVRRICEDVVEGRRQIETVDENVIASALYTAGMPDPDLLIRTAGEMRVSNFLLWQISYAELHITDALWPDFDAEHFYEAIQSYAQRERRFGKVTTQVGSDSVD